MLRVIRGLGRRVTDRIWRLGFASRFFLAILLHSGTSLRRINLTLREIYFTGVLSLIIILVSGLFVGMVLGLQGYDTLQRYGSSEALGVLVALSLVRELGPVVAALLFASRAGSAITAEIGLMKATEQLSAMEMMAVDPIARVVAPRFWGGVISMPLLAALFSAMGVFGGYLVGVQLIGVDGCKRIAGKLVTAIDIHRYHSHVRFRIETDFRHAPNHHTRAFNGSTHLQSADVIKLGMQGVGFGRTRRTQISHFERQKQQCRQSNCNKKADPEVKCRSTHIKPLETLRQ